MSVLTDTVTAHCGRRVMAEGEELDMRWVAMRAGAPPRGHWVRDEKGEDMKHLVEGAARPAGRTYSSCSFVSASAGAAANGGEAHRIRTHDEQMSARVGCMDASTGSFIVWRSMTTLLRGRPYFWGPSWATWQCTNAALSGGGGALDPAWTRCRAPVRFSSLALSTP